MTKKNNVVAVKLDDETFEAMEDLCIDLRIRRNSEFLREAVAEKLQRHGKVVGDAMPDQE